MKWCSARTRIYTGSGRICFPGFGNGFVAISLLFFAFTTIMAYYYIAETNIAYLNRDKDRPWLSMVLKFVF
ncbi:alanine:cation symporter family protein [Bacillus cereus]